MQDIIVELVNQYGLIGVIAAACLVGLTWFSNNKISKSNNKVTSSVDKLSEAIVEQNGELMKTLSENNKQMQSQFVEIVAKAMDTVHKERKDEHLEQMGERVDITEEIKSIIKEINDKCHACRTILFEFHNSNENFNGVPFVKYDATSEWPARDSKSLLTTIKDFQFTILYPVIKSLYNNEHNIVHYNKQWIDNELYDLSAVLHAQYREINVHDVIYVGCYSKENRMIGTVAIEFNDKHPYIDSNISNEEITTAVEQISVMLRLKEK